MRWSGRSGHSLLLALALSAMLIVCYAGVVLGLDAYNSAALD